MNEKSEVREAAKRGISTWQKVTLWLGGAALLGAAAHFGVLGDTLAGTATVIGPDPHMAPVPSRADDTRSTARAGAPGATSEPARVGAPPASSAAAPSASADPSAAAESDRPARRAEPLGADDVEPRAQDGSARPAEPPAAPTSSAITADGKVIMNLATEVELRKLPGIGHARAQAILALREKLGRFRRVEELLRVKGIGRKRLAALRPKIVLDAP